MGKRSHEALRARDLGLASLRAERVPRRPLPLEPTKAACTAWLRRTHTTLEAPTDRRPYWTVWLGPTYLAAGQTAARAVTAAMYKPLPQRVSNERPFTKSAARPENPEQSPGGLTGMILVHSPSPRG